jgi:hypothetical protein
VLVEARDASGGEVVLQNPRIDWDKL